MKLFFAFLFCSITCCLAVPYCSPEEIEKCFEPGLKKTEQNVLDTVCKYTECTLEIYEKCGTAIFGLEGAYPLKGYRKFVDNLCYDTPIRRKYLENAKCLENVVGEFGLLVIMDKCGIYSIRNLPREEFCREIPAGMRCAVDYVTEKCNKDAGDAFKIMALPSFDPYDCLS